ncbi:MAG: flagellar hook-basal body complex protein FliE [Bdellovibrionales bacterium RIFCSPHIGHO2_01_FULL_40_29]|nr:MAG: flagellar hook-basal body complex protein FliE [Bdellovibrionales bacterium RIFCSPHIGHO2_01_FULL_40_29]OFZ32915.1 MAG: flagellar hook-basal body complex protein FliE [Bdellovibrionales bacterium RIFCSPHIGHO2_02_FULL_40_15]
MSNANRFLETANLEGKNSKVDLNSISSSGTAGPSFADTLKEAVNNVNQIHLDADKKAQELATGKTDDIAGVMLASEKADIALRTMVQVRNKIIDAYQEIMKMQV